MGVATKQILSGIGHGVPSRGSREGRRRERGEGPPQFSVLAAAGGEKIMGNQHPLEQNHVTSSAIGTYMYDVTVKLLLQCIADILTSFNVPVRCSFSIECT